LEPGKATCRWCADAPNFSLLALRQSRDERRRAMYPEFDGTKRRFVTIAGASGLVVLGGFSAPQSGLVTPVWAAEKSGKAKGKEAESKENIEEVTPPEDLMREHGVLDRVLLIYEAAMRKMSTHEDFDPLTVVRAAEVVRDFIENYHEKSEEEAVFPRFKQKGAMTNLVDTLLVQHRAGRRVTANILMLAPKIRQDGDAQNKVLTSMQSFIAMYRPHAAREDTDLFPKLHEVVSKNEYDAMAEDFEKKEHQLFGADGFEKMVDRVADLERSIGINDLNQFTPRSN
jgi:hemerythrin-like domain-containing protein